MHRDHRVRGRSSALSCSPATAARPRDARGSRRRRAPRRPSGSRSSSCRSARQAGITASSAAPTSFWRRNPAAHCGSRQNVAALATLLRHARAQGSDPLRRQGHPPAADHPHERQATGAGRQQAGPVLRHRGDGPGGDRAGRDHHRARDRRRDPGGRRRRRALRRRADLHRPGRAGSDSPTRC